MKKERTAALDAQNYRFNLDQQYLSDLMKIVYKHKVGIF